VRFKEFLELSEAGTFTNSIAGFSRMTIPLVRRIWPPQFGTDWGQDIESGRKKGKKPYAQPQVKENQIN
jgi:hypothetical protein